MRIKVWAVLALLLVSGVVLIWRPSEDEPSDLSDYEAATFAGGCFWCMEAAFEATEGVIEAISGYTGGHTVDPTYEQVLSKTTGHLEAVQVYYDPRIVSYDELLDVYWMNIDPTDDTGQFVDKGEQYLTAIFYLSDEERVIAEESREALGNSGRFNEPIVTEIRELDVFFRAEESHQDYYKKNVLNYKLYSSASGREEFQKEYWGE